MATESVSEHNPKQVTYDRAATKLERAIEGSRRLGLDDVADHYASMSVEDYIAEKGLVLVNPSQIPTTKNQRSENAMSTNLSTLTKTELQHELSDAESMMDAIWNALVDLDEDSSKDDLVDGIFDACELLNEYDADRFPMDDDEEAEANTPED